MKNFLIQQLLGPTIRRLGTFVGGWLVSVGMEQDLATQVETVAIAAALFAIDLGNSALNRRSVEANR